MLVGSTPDNDLSNSSKMDRRDQEPVSAAAQQVNNLSDKKLLGPPEERPNHMERTFVWPVSACVSTGQTRATGKATVHVKVVEYSPKIKGDSEAALGIKTPTRSSRIPGFQGSLLQWQEPASLQSKSAHAQLLASHPGTSDETPKVDLYCLLEGCDFVRLPVWTTAPVDAKDAGADVVKGNVKMLEHFGNVRRQTLASTSRAARLEVGPGEAGEVHATIISETHVYNDYKKNDEQAQPTGNKGETTMQYRGVLHPTTRFVSELERLEEVYYKSLRRTLQGEEQQENHHLNTAIKLKQILLLHMHHAHLNQFAAFLTRFELDYANRKRQLVSEILTSFNSDDKKSASRSLTTLEDMLKTLRRDSDLYQQLGAQVDDGLVLTIDSLLDLVTTTAPKSSSPEVEMLRLELRGCIKDLSATMKRIHEGYEHIVGVLEQERRSEHARTTKVMGVLFMFLVLVAGIVGHVFSDRYSAFVATGAGFAFIVGVAAHA